MIRCKATLPDGRPLYLFGIDAENVRRLTEGEPIIAVLESVGGVGTMVIVYGDTVEDARDEIQRCLEIELPPISDMPDLPTVKPNCYECTHRRDVPGDAHSACVNGKANVVGDPYGAANRWFAYPFNFDPIWLVSCDGFEPKRLDTKEDSA